MSDKIDAKEMARNIIAAIEKNKGWLSEIDGAIGDGDHGINMAKGLGQAGQKLDQTPDSASDVLKFLGMTLLSNIGGAMGPIYGTFFMRMGKELEGKQRIEKQDLQKMLDSALEGVKARGKAEVGEKTLVDALQPAGEEYARAVASGKNMKEAIDAMIDGARRGMERTKDLVARKGRSSRLGERSRGTIDAGAASCYVILSAMGEFLKKYADRKGSG